MAYWKKIKNTNAVPVLKDELVFDQTPTVNSTNPVTSDGVARAIAGASGEVPVVTENDNGKVLKAIYDAGGPAVEWGEATVDQTYDATSANAQSGVAVAQAIAAIPSASYTAGDGIDIDAQNAVSVKAGNGLSIGNASGQGQIQLSSSRVSNGEIHSYADDICTLTSDLLDIICNGQGGLSVTLSRPVSFFSQVFVQPAICCFSSETGSRTNAQGVFGEAIYIDRTLPAGTTLTFDSSAFTNIEWIDLSYLQTLSDSELAHYHLAVIEANGSHDAGSFYDTNPTATSIDTATYPGTVTIQDALNVSNPLPASAVGDAGKVLTVDAAGAAAWATPSGVTKQVISLTGSTSTYDETSRTFTFTLDAANQFYALGKLVSVNYKSAYKPAPGGSVDGSKIKLYYGTSGIVLNATTYGTKNIFCASVFVGNENNMSSASDPSLGFLFNKVEIVVPAPTWMSIAGETESLQIQILG